MTVHEVSKLLFRELEFPLKDIKAIINSPDFDRSKLDEYSRQAKELYGSTPEYKEMEEKQKNRTEEDEKILADRFMLLFKEAGKIKNSDPASIDAQNLVKYIDYFKSIVKQQIP